MSNVVAGTYVAGEDDSRLARAAQNFGLNRARQPLGNVRAAVNAMLNDNTLESARMHSIGAIGDDERIDNNGTLHVLTLTKRKRREKAGTVPNYGTLQNLFQAEPMELEEGVEEGSDEEVIEEIIDTVEGGSLTAAIFGIVKGMVCRNLLY